MSELEAVHVSHTYPNTDRQVLDDVSVGLRPGEILAIVGESGCGKTTLGRLLAGLHHPSSGTISFDGTDITKLRGKAQREWRRQVQMVHQDPYGSLNPGLTLGSTLSAGLLRSGLANRRTVEQQMLDLLHQVGLDATLDFLNRYPHQLSGGQRQRVAIARAIGMQPRFVIADEVTSMLDVSMRVAILDLLLQFQKDLGIGFVFISHDFGVVRYFARQGRIAVMFFGHLVEEGPTDELIMRPRHPYTRMLLEAIPVPDPSLARRRQAQQSPEDHRLVAEPSRRGCVFANRCPLVRDVCRTQPPPLAPVPGDDVPRSSACWFPTEVPERTLVGGDHHVRPGSGSTAAAQGGGSHPAPGPVAAAVHPDVS